MFFLILLNFICHSCNQSFSRTLFILLSLMCVVCCSVIVGVLRRVLPCFPIILTFMHWDLQIWCHDLCQAVYFLTWVPWT
jgi:hypothetical protein